MNDNELEELHLKSRIKINNLIGTLVKDLKCNRIR